MTLFTSLFARVRRSRPANNHEFPLTARCLLMEGHASTRPRRTSYLAVALSGSADLVVSPRRNERDDSPSSAGEAEAGVKGAMQVHAA